jgi:hypothetical protein
MSAKSDRPRLVFHVSSLTLTLGLDRLSAKRLQARGHPVPGATVPLSYREAPPTRGLRAKREFLVAALSSGAVSSNSYPEPGQVGGKLLGRCEANARYAYSGGGADVCWIVVNEKALLWLSTDGL